MAQSGAQGTIDDFGDLARGEVHDEIVESVNSASMTFALFSIKPSAIIHGMLKPLFISIMKEHLCPTDTLSIRP